MADGMRRRPARRHARGETQSGAAPTCAHHPRAHRRLARIALTLLVIAAGADAASARTDRARRRVRHRPLPERIELAPLPAVPVAVDPRSTIPGLAGFDLGVLGAGISGASTALPPGFGFYGPSYHGPGYGQPGY